MDPYTPHLKPLEDNFVCLADRIMVGRCFAYTFTDEVKAEVKKGLKNRTIVAKKGNHNTVCFLFNNKGNKLPFDGPTARLIYPMAVDMNLVSHDLLPMAEVNACSL